MNLLATDRPFLDPGEPVRVYEAGAPGHEQVLLPEYPTWRDRSVEVAAHASGWLNDEVSRQRLIARLATLRDRFAIRGASKTAADYIARHLGPSEWNVLPLRRAS